MNKINKELSENDKFKVKFNERLWMSLIIATTVHFVILQYSPTLTPTDIGISNQNITAIELPPEIEIPPVPERISRPATPIIAATTIDEDITIATTTFETNPISDLPPPPTETRETAEDISSAPTFTPYTVAPALLNRDEVMRAMLRLYPESLRRSNIGGVVRVYLFINQNGIVQDSRVHESSGFVQLDEASLTVAGIYRFSPAMNRDKTVPVWVSLPIEWNVR